VKLVAIQFNPTQNWPSPKPQPSASAARIRGALATSPARMAKATGISGHSPNGWKAKADKAPTMTATRNFMARGRGFGTWAGPYANTRSGEMISQAANVIDNVGAKPFCLRLGGGGA